MNKTIIRQGDVMLVRVAGVPAGLVQTKKVVLALGEATGHHHAIKTKGVKGYGTDQKGLASYVEIAEALADLTHEEHGTIQIEPGIYEVRIQREYVAPAIERKVVD